MLGAQECRREVHDPHEGGALEPGADAHLEYGEGVEVSIPSLEEELFGG